MKGFVYEFRTPCGKFVKLNKDSIMTAKEYKIMIEALGVDFINTIRPKNQPGAK